MSDDEDDLDILPLGSMQDVLQVMGLFASDRMLFLCRHRNGFYYGTHILVDLSTIIYFIYIVYLYSIVINGGLLCNKYAYLKKSSGTA